MDRCAYDLDYLISRQPHAPVKSSHASRAHTPAVNELEYLDVFDLFNFPRMPTSVESGMVPNPVPGVNHDAHTQVNASHPAMGHASFAQPNPETDWLFHAT